MEPGCREGDGHTLGAEGGRAPTGASLSAASKSFSLSVQLYISILSGQCIFVSAQAFKSHTTAAREGQGTLRGNDIGAEVRRWPGEFWLTEFTERESHANK